MEIKFESSDSKGAFYIEGNGRRIAESTFSRAGINRIIIDHTEVDSTLKGLGVGLKLIEAAIAYARENDIKILPLCPFAKSVFDKNPGYSDVRF